MEPETFIALTHTRVYRLPTARAVWWFVVVTLLLPLSGSTPAAESESESKARAPPPPCLTKRVAYIVSNVPIMRSVRGARCANRGVQRSVVCGCGGETNQ